MPFMMVRREPGMAAASARWRSAGITQSLRGITTAVGTSTCPSHGVEWWRPSAATACATAHGLVLRHSASAHWPMSVGPRSSSSTPERAARRTVRDFESVRSAPIETSIPEWKTVSWPLVRKWSVDAARTRPPTRSPCCRQVRWATIEPIE